MSPRELLVQLREKGVEIKSNGDRLIIDAPKGAITPDLRDALAANKAELLKILNAPLPVEKPSPGAIEKSEAPKPVAPSAVWRVASSRSQSGAPAPPPVPVVPPSAPPAQADVEASQATSVVAAEITQLEAELARLR